MTNTDWEVIKEFYKEKFGFEGWLVEMYANLDILALCTSGASNESISTFLELPVSEIVKVICEVFEFDGWSKDLPLNPYHVFSYYDGTRTSLEHYKAFVSDVTVELKKFPELSGVKAEKLFEMCAKYYDIEERIQNEWI